MDEVWKTVKGFKNYQVSNLGRVRSKMRVTYKDGMYGTVIRREARGKILSPSEREGGYYVVYLANDKNTSSQPVHWMVANAFLEHEDGKDFIIHKNYDKKDNRAENLQWVTRKEYILFWWLHDQEDEEE